jgi:Neuraminidase (sialidase)
MVTNPVNSVDLVASAWAFVCAGTVAVTSVDAGSQWVPNCLNNLAEDGDPAIAYGRKSLYAAGATQPPPAYVQVSRDDGKSWSRQIEVTPPILNDGITNVPWVAVDNSDGTFKNAAYISVTQFDALIVESEISVSHSTDEGQTWTTTTVDAVQYKPAVDQFSRMVVGKDGTVYVAWQRCTMTSKAINCAGTKATMLLSKSTDGGNTWSEPGVIATVRLTPETCDGCENPFFGNLPNTNEGMANMPVLAIDNGTGKYAGNLYAAVYDWTGKQMRAEVVTSTDGGNTWGQPVAVAPAEETHDQFFPTIAVSPTGVLGVGWLDRRNDPLNISYQPFAAVSTNGGVSFGTNYVLASNLSDPYLDGAGGIYMGDYVGATWSGSNFVVTWPDTRNLEYMQDYVGGVRIK